MPTKAEQYIENLLKQVEPGSTRYTILHSAKQFKSSWVELGQLLSEVRHAQLYQEWGYADFAEYCAREIRIRRQTADKLTHAYHYLKEHNPTPSPARKTLHHCRTIAASICLNKSTAKL